MLSRQDQLAEALYDVRDILETAEGEAESEAEASLKQARETAELARAEVKADFPLLHAHSLVGMWGALEALVQEVVVAWLTNRKGLLAESEFASVKVPVAEFQRMKVVERLEYLLDQFPRRPGIGGGFPRLEELLDKVDLGGAVDERLRRVLIELHQVRNVYAHRGGLADRKALTACPWRKEWKVGQQIKVGRADYTRYVNGLDEYAIELIARSGAKFGVDVRKFLAKRAAERGEEMTTASDRARSASE